MSNVKVRKMNTKQELVLRIENITCRLVINALCANKQYNTITLTQVGVDIPCVMYRGGEEVATRF
jgi:hypothetical protein